MSNTTGLWQYPTSLLPEKVSGFILWKVHLTVNGVVYLSEHIPTDSSISFFYSVSREFYFSQNNIVSLYKSCLLFNM